METTPTSNKNIKFCKIVSWATVEIITGYRYEQGIYYTTSIGEEIDGNITDISKFPSTHKIIATTPSIGERSVFGLMPDNSWVKLGVSWNPNETEVDWEDKRVKTITQRRDFQDKFEFKKLTTNEYTNSNTLNNPETCIDVSYDVLKTILGEPFVNNENNEFPGDKNHSDVCWGIKSPIGGIIKIWNYSNEPIMSIKHLGLPIYGIEEIRKFSVNYTCSEFFRQFISEIEYYIGNTQDASIIDGPKIG